MREMPPGDHCDPGERGHGAGGRRGNSRHGGRLGNSNNRDNGDVMRKILLLLALCATAAAGQQDLCDFTAEADAADIDGLELLMGDPADSCEGYSVSFVNFKAALAITVAAGSDNYIQFNDGGVFAGDADFLYDAAAVDAATKLSVIGSLATTKVDGYGRLTVDQAATCPSTFGGFCVSWSGTVLARFGANLGISTDKADSSGTGKFLFATTTEVGLSNYNGPVILNPATSGAHQETSFLANGAMRLPAIATAPATCTAYRDFYVDTSGAFCWCSATNTWAVFTGGGTCA